MSDQPPAAINNRVETGLSFVSPVQMPTLTLGGNIASVTDDGTVRIDWPKVEEAARPHDPTASAWVVDGVTRSIARMLIAVRDHTSKTFDER
jgi:hypothetical protein